jgi:hypothetical protein
VRDALGGAKGQPDAVVIDRINPEACYAAGNLAVLSQGASAAAHGMAVPAMLRLAPRTLAGGEIVAGMDGAAWLRLAVLRSFATPLPFAQAARLPLAVLPPNRVRMLNAAQGLQALLTLQFATPGWSARTRAIAEFLPQHTLRHDYNLFIGAIAPRVLEAAATPAGLRQALEDAWLGERVQRRWQHFVLSLGEAGTQSLLERATANGLAALRTWNWGHEQAVEGWALAEGGRAQPTLTLPDPRAPWPRTTPAPAASRQPRPASQLAC